MDEYAIFNGERIKIGTCEDMIYLRADQAPLVTPVSNSTDPVAEADEIRFRFPWPEEDGIDPGCFVAGERRLVMEGVDVPEGVEHREGCTLNSYSLDRVKLWGQAWRDGKLVAICDCAGCGKAYKLPTLDAAKPLIDHCVREVAIRIALEKESIQEARGRYAVAHDGQIDFYLAVAERILAGYSAVQPVRCTVCRDPKCIPVAAYGGVCCAKEIGRPSRLDYSPATECDLYCAPGSPGEHSAGCASRAVEVADEGTVF